jgi:probable phosphoglycerate mutase
MSIYLIRHGQTDLNAARVIQFPDTPLSVRGLEQARRVGKRLAGSPIDLVLSSDYARTRQTAEGVVLGTGAPLEFDALLRERNFGDLRGTAHNSHIEDVFAEGYAPVNGETAEVFHERVVRAWTLILEVAGRLQRDLAVVTHGLVLNSLMDRILSLPEEAAQQAWVVENTSLTVVDPAPPYRIGVMACARHLDGMD